MTSAPEHPPGNADARDERFLARGAALSSAAWAELARRLYGPVQRVIPCVWLS